MPARLPHLPSYRERCALQMLRWKDSEFERKFAPIAGPHAIATLIKKGWIIRLPGEPPKLAITSVGLAAVEAPI